MQSAKLSTRVLISFPVVLFVMFLVSCNHPPASNGLVGAWYGESDLRRWKDSSTLTDLTQKFDDRNGHGKSWSAQWVGMLKGPGDGKIEFILESDQSAMLTIGNSSVEVSKAERRKKMELLMKSDKLYPVLIKYKNTERPNGFFSVKWASPGKTPQTISKEYLSHTIGQENYWIWKDSLKTIKIKKIPVSNKYVYRQKDRFAGWPANGGIWSWGNEILVSFNTGFYKKNFSESHSYDKDKPTYKALARSLDGGETWTVETPKDLFSEQIKPTRLTSAIDFRNPGFALHCDKDFFHYSYDKGKTWNGPYSLNQPFKEITARTDYLVEDKNTCLIFISAKQELTKDDNDDRAYVAKTKDGGRTFTFLSWMTEEPFTARSVMPATVRISGNHLISILRRRKDVEHDNRPDESRNWLDAYQSVDNGKSWTFLSKIADTGIPNGNPPSLVLTKDRKLCVIYGVRSRPFGIRTKVSLDNGVTWGPEYQLRDDALDWDFGYCRSVLRNDGKILSIYYLATKNEPQQHIEASIWEPGSIR